MYRNPPVDLNTIDTIFQTEGWIGDIGPIGEKPRLIDANRVYPQDIVDAVRYIVVNNLIPKACIALEQSGVDRVSFDLKLVSHDASRGFTPVPHDASGRPIPKLELEVGRIQPNATTKYYGRLQYFEDVWRAMEFISGVKRISVEFDIPKEFYKS